MNMPIYSNTARRRNNPTCIIKAFVETKSKSEEITLKWENYTQKNLLSFQ